MMVRIEELVPEDFIGALRVARTALGDRAPPPLALAAYMVVSGGIGVKASIDDELVGFAIAEVKEWMGHVLFVAVDPEFQDRGVGTMLMGELERRAAGAGVKVMRLEALKGSRAVSFYKRLGYEVVAEIENYYPYGDAVVMEKTLS